jgi:hypothetical protein
MSVSTTNSDPVRVERELVGLRIPADLMRRVRAIAASGGETNASIVRRLLRRALDENEGSARKQR